MNAFIPCGAPLSKSRDFVTGGLPVSARTSHPRVSGPTVPTETSALKLPNVNLPKLPDLPFAKKKAPPAAPAAPAVVAKKEAPVTLLIGGQKIVANAVDASKSVLSDGLPKFYNPGTASHVFQSKAAGQGATAFDVRRRVTGFATPINARVNDQETFRNMDLYTDNLVWARPDWSSDEARVAVKVAIRNVFGNANLFESELAELAYSISCVTKTADMREFVRALGLSEAYRSRFFEPCSNQRFVELNFKHFYGRAPRTQAEVSEHIQILTMQGYNAEINSYIDSVEYDKLWGKSRVPAVNFRGGHQYNVDMNKTAVLNGSYVSSDRTSKKSFFSSGDASGLTGFGIFKGLPEAWRGENLARNEAGPLASFPTNAFWNTAPQGLLVNETEWKARFGSWFPYYYKNSAVYKEISTPSLSHTESEVAEANATLKYGSLMAKNYVGAKKSFDKAPVITLNAPVDGLGGSITVALEEIEPEVPSSLQPEAYSAFSNK